MPTPPTRTTDGTADGINRFITSSSGGTATLSLSATGATYSGDLGRRRRRLSTVAGDFLSVASAAVGFTSIQATNLDSVEFIYDIPRLQGGNSGFFFFRGSAAPSGGRRRALQGDAAGGPDLDPLPQVDGAPPPPARSQPPPQSPPPLLAAADTSTLAAEATTAPAGEPTAGMATREPSAGPSSTPIAPPTEAPKLQPTNVLTLNPMFSLTETLAAAPMLAQLPTNSPTAAPHAMRVAAAQRRLATTWPAPPEQPAPLPTPVATPRHKDVSSRRQAASAATASAAVAAGAYTYEIAGYAAGRFPGRDQVSSLYT